MFNDFKRKRDRRAIGFFILSLAISASLVGSALAWSVFGRQPEQAPVEEEEEVVVEFAPPPEVEPEPEPEPEVVEPPPQPAAVFRPAAVRPQIVTPTEIPDEELEESDAELTEARDTGPVGGDTRGVPGGTGTGTTTQIAPAEPPPPPPEPPPARERRQVRVSMEEIRRPAIIGGPRSPEVPRAARSQGVQGVVLVRVVIDEQGRLRRYEIVRGPEIFYDAVRTWLRAIRFSPATRADGTATAWTGMIPARFNARNL